MKSARPLIDEKESNELEQNIDNIKDIVYINISLQKTHNEHYIEEYLEFSKRSSAERIQIVVRSIQKAYDEAKQIHGNDKKYLILLRENFFEGTPLECKDAKGNPYISKRLSIKNDKANRISSELSQLTERYHDMYICWGGGNLVRKTVNTNEIQKLKNVKEAYSHLNYEKEIEKTLGQASIIKHEEMITSILEYVEKEENTFKEVVELVNKGTIFSNNSSQIFYKYFPALEETKSDSLIEYRNRQLNARPHFFHPMKNEKNQNTLKFNIETKMFEVKLEICRDHVFSKDKSHLQILFADWLYPLGKNFHGDWLILASSQCEAKLYKKDHSKGELLLYNFNCYNGEFKKIQSQHMFNFKVVDYFTQLQESLQLKYNDTYLNSLINFFKLSDFESRQGFIDCINELTRALNSNYIKLFEDKDNILFWCKCITLFNKTIIFAYDAMIEKFEDSMKQFNTEIFFKKLYFNGEYSETLEKYVENNFEESLDICTNFLFKNKINPFFVTFNKDGGYLCPYVVAAIKKDEELCSTYKSWYKHQRPVELNRKMVERKVEFRKK